MDTRPEETRRSAELATLRQRAYGPQADIAADPVALERLQHLEDEARRESDVDDAPSLDADDTDAAESAEPGAETRSDPTVQPEVEGDPQQRTPERATPWFGRIPGWLVGLVSLVLGGAVTLSASALVSPHPDQVLQIVPEASGTDQDWMDALEDWGIRADDADSFGEYNGVGVWVVTSAQTQRCLFLERDGEPVNLGCAVRGLDPILDLLVVPGVDMNFEEPPPLGSAIRFILRGDVVEVWESGDQPDPSL